MHLYIYN